MKVVIITPVFPPYGGGIGIVAFQHAEILSAAGYDVTVVAPAADGKESGGQRWSYQQCRPRLRHGNAAWLPQLDRELPSDALVHLHYPFIGAVNAAVRWRRTHPATRLVLHYHMDLVSPGWRGFAFSQFQRRALPKLLDCADRVVVLTRDYAVSSSLANWLEQYPHRFVELPNGVDVHRFQPGPKPPALAQRWGLIGARTVLFVGGLDPAHYFKGLEFLLAAVSQLPQDTHLLVVGEGSRRRRYETLARRMQVASRVHFAGAVPFAELPQYYQLANIFALPSWTRSEAFGLVLLEAMASGLPAVATGLPGVRTVVVDGVTGLLAQPADAPDLTRKLTWLLGNPERAAAMGQAGRQRVLGRYDWALVGRELVALYHDLGVSPRV